MGIFRNLLNKRSLAIATSSKEESSLEEQEKQARKKEKALTKLIGFDEGTLKVDDTVDRFWIEHGYPFMTTYHYIEGFETLHDVAGREDTLLIDLYIEEHEMRHTLQNPKDDVWTIHGTGSMFQYINGTYETITIRIENVHDIIIKTTELLVDRDENFDTRNDNYYKTSLEIPMDKIMEAFNNILA